MYRIAFALALGLLFLPAQTRAQTQAQVVASCGTVPQQLQLGRVATIFQDQNGQLCTNVTGGAGGTASNFGAAFPSSGTAAGFNDGTNMQGARVFDADTGAGTQYVVGTNLRISASGGSIEAKGQQLMAASLPVAFASDQSTLPVVATQSGTWAVRIQDALGTAFTGITRGAQYPLSVQIVDASGNQVTSFGGSGGTASNYGSAFPASGTAVGFSDGTNMQGARVFDADTGAGTQYVAGVNLRLSASGGSIEAQGQQAMAASIPVVIASNQSAFPVTQSGTWTVQPGNTANTTAWLVTGTGGIFPATQSGTWTVQPGNTANTTAWLIDARGNVAAGAADSGNPVKVAGKYNSTLPTLSDGQRGDIQLDLNSRVRTVVENVTGTAQAATASGTTQSGIMIEGRTSDLTAVTNGQMSRVIGTLDGKAIVHPYAIPENAVSGVISSAMTGTTSTSLVAAPGSGVRNYITACTFSNSHATVGTDMILQDGSGGTTIWLIPAAAVFGGAHITFPMPLRQPTANTALFVANVTTGANTKAACGGFKGL